jgi:hypothetical protein
MNRQILSIALIITCLLSSTDAFSPSIYTSTITGSTATRLVVQNAKRVNYDDTEDVVGMTSRTMKEFLLCTATAVIFVVAPVLPVSASSYSDIDRCECVHYAHFSKRFHSFPLLINQFINYPLDCNFKQNHPSSKKCHRYRLLIT